MIWAILVLLGVPLWLCAFGVLTVILRNRALRKRHGDIPVRVLGPGKKRWIRGHAVWISDVFAWRGSPAAWSEGLAQVVGASVAPAAPEEMKRLHRLGDDPVVATMVTDGSTTLRVAVADGDRAALLGPFRPTPDQNALGV
jgi:hypothetical protein